MLETAVAYTETASVNAPEPVFLSVTLNPFNLVSATSNDTYPLAIAAVLTHEQNKSFDHYLGC